MKRKLFSQMRTEWRTNVWMIIELTIVGFIVVIITTILSQLFFLRNRSTGYDLNDIYVGTANILTKDADDFVKYDDNQLYFDDMGVILRKLRENPYAEIVATGISSMPYNYNYNGNGLSYNSDGDSLFYMGNMRFYSPELIKLLRLTGPNGETTEQLASTIERGEWLVSPHGDYSIKSCDPYKLKGKTVIINYDSTLTAYVGNVCHGITRDDYEPIYGGCILRPMGNRFPSDIVVRVKPGMGRKFMESLKAKDLSQGNVYVNNFTSIDDMRDNCQRSIDIFQRNIVICAGFLLIAVFLGFLGSFWFRTQQRVPEIALRKVNGATRQQIFNRLISEGLIMLLISAIIFSPIYFFIIHSSILDDLELDVNSQLPNYIAYVITLMILAAMIVAGIWIPARKAMDVEPANALKDQ